MTLLNSWFPKKPRLSWAALTEAQWLEQGWESPVLLRTEGTTWMLVPQSGTPSQKGQEAFQNYRLSSGREQPCAQTADG